MTLKMQGERERWVDTKLGEPIVPQMEHLEKYGVEVETFRL